MWRYNVGNYNMENFRVGKFRLIYRNANLIIVWLFNSEIVSFNSKFRRCTAFESIQRERVVCVCVCVLGDDLWLGMRACSALKENLVTFSLWQMALIVKRPRLLTSRKKMVDKRIIGEKEKEITIRNFLLNFQRAFFSGEIKKKLHRQL
jgi:hypothetical protein